MTPAPDFAAQAARHVHQTKLAIPTPAEAFDADAARLYATLTTDQHPAFDALVRSVHALASAEYRRGLGER